MDLSRVAVIRDLGLPLLVALALSACSSAWLRWEERTVTYTVQPGDTLYQIAFKHQLDYRELAWWNGIGREYLIKPGQVLRLDPPLPGELRSPPEAPPRTGGPPSQRASAPPPASQPSQAPATTSPPRSPVATDAGPRRWRWPVRGDILTSYDPTRGRKGIDIAGQQGDPVRAAADGKVVYAGGALKGYGQLVIVKHGEEYLTAYGHNARLMVREGQMVKAGEQLATMGLGPTNRPLLHFEVRRFGKPRNPLELLPPPG